MVDRECFSRDDDDWILSLVLRLEPDPEQQSDDDERDKEMSTSNPNQRISTNQLPTIAYCMLANEQMSRL